MSEKKVVVFIVEGPSDEAALGSIMKGYFSNDEVQFVVTHGDITLKDYVSDDNILKKINEQIDSVKRKYRYGHDDFLKIIHIADTDGVYIPKTDVKEADVKEIQYFEEYICAKDAGTIIQRNKRKGDILYKLRKTGKVNGIPYRIYFNSCNLEHVLYGKLHNYSDEEKQILSDDFADRYDGRTDAFIKFISDSLIAVPGTYQKTWDYIEKNRNSLNRHTNMHLIFN
ncbi:hypothetical protein C823_001309 [Eubacterium plexicaudatum ASF492]|uniref:Uncharacterized protein n=1 Tax=Eubacterium plexicaudatum ASF492 TaxID=1235802 RepID=N2B633_9FIRM|nr:hypothetical protein C823_001309 [Eubacterium plexicaudatum ASF492]